LETKQAGKEAAMLVLTRKVEQRIHIGPDITLTIVRVRGQSVKIGIDAPLGMDILREELVASALVGPAASPAPVESGASAV
jgi:carbon storage regulator